MSENLPSREQAIQLLRQSGCSRYVVRHCRTVSELAVEIAKACKEKGLNIDLELVEIGALLHDIGRSKTHTVHHVVVGVEIAESLGLPEIVISIIKRHVGGGIAAREARKLRWPKDIYIPQTLEEKIVSYADKLIDGSKRVPIEDTIEKFSEKGRMPPSAIERMRRLHEEILVLVGDCKCLP
ncbi:MAG: TIGR00295 family protein [Candidatus Bathyarchaeota archaeon]|nr:TIGR00295 family protein [Candidatus Bathyarchaeota archaeon]